MTSITPAAIIDRDGNLLLHGRGGASITIDFEDAAGAARTIREPNLAS